MFELDSRKISEVDDVDAYLGCTVPGSLLAEPLYQVRTRPPLVVSPEWSVADVVRLMNDRDVDCALVASRGRLLGIFTESDLRRRVLMPATADLAQPIITVATTPVISVPREASVAFALRTMRTSQVSHLPLTNDDGEAVEILSPAEVARWLADRLPAHHA